MTEVRKSRMSEVQATLKLRPAGRGQRSERARCQRSEVRKNQMSEVRGQKEPALGVFVPGFFLIAQLPRAEDQEIDIPAFEVVLRPGSE